MAASHTVPCFLSYKRGGIQWAKVTGAAGGEKSGAVRTAIRGHESGRGKTPARGNDVARWCASRASFAHRRSAPERGCAVPAPVAPPVRAGKVNLC